MLVKLENGMIKQIPRNAQLSTGVWVSNYNLLPEETLRAEGWKELEEVKPELGENQHYEQGMIEEQDTKIVVTYVAVDNPEEQPTVSELQAEIETLTGIIAEMMEG